MKKNFESLSLVSKGFCKRVMLGISALILTVSAANALECTPETNTPDIVIAVASNMWEPAQALVDIYEANVVNPSINIQVCHDATGVLLPLINAGNSNFSLFLAANETAPSQVNSDFTIGIPSIYTVGIPVLWSENASLLYGTAPNYFNGSINLNNVANAGGKVVIANPATAPYGLAGKNIMINVTNQWNATNNMNLLFTASNIDNAYNNISAHGNYVGYVALSQICRNGDIQEGFAYRDYPDIYDIPQAGIVIDQGEIKNTYAIAFWEWIHDDEYTPIDDNAQHILVNTFCYGALPQSDDE
jgi:molybdate transport system substrate-binding protein